MKNLFSLIFLCVFALTANAQGGIRYFQLKELPTGHIMINNGSGNTNAELNAGLIPVNTIPGLSATDAQAAFAELQANINSAGDGWGTDVVTTGNTLSGDGTSGDPLNVDPSQISTSTLDNDAGFLTQGQLLSAAAGGPNQMLLQLSQANGQGGGTVLVQATGAIELTENAGSLLFNAVDATQTLTRSSNDAVLNDISGSGGGTVSVTDDLTKGSYTATGGETTFNVSVAPQGGAKELRVYRNGVVQVIGTDVTFSGTTGTITGFALEAGEVISWEFV